MLPVRTTVAVAHLPEVSLYMRSGEVCGDEYVDLEIRLTGGIVPWSFVLTTPNGTLVNVDDISRSSYVYRAVEAGLYEVVKIKDSVCEGVAAKASAKVEVRHWPKVDGWLHDSEERTCQVCVVCICVHVYLCLIDDFERRLYARWMDIYIKAHIHTAIHTHMYTTTHTHNHTHAHTYIIIHTHA